MFGTWWDVPESILQVLRTKSDKMPGEIAMIAENFLTSCDPLGVGRFTLAVANDGLLYAVAWAHGQAADPAKPPSRSAANPPIHQSAKPTIQGGQSSSYVDVNGERGFLTVFDP